MIEQEVEGQLNQAERAVLVNAILEAQKPVNTVLEVGTWLGGGSTLHFLKALEQKGTGRLLGIEADKEIFERMVANLTQVAPDLFKRFVPLLGFSGDVIREMVQREGPSFRVDVAFLDGGNNPGEQIEEFQLLDPIIPVGGRLLSHDAKLRKGKWLVPYVSALDNWESELLDISMQGLFKAVKTKDAPSEESKRRASRVLMRCRMEPAEIAAALLPASVCGKILGFLPKRVADRLANGV